MVACRQPDQGKDVARPLSKEIYFGTSTILRGVQARAHAEVRE